jgi:hypothetical protein
MKRFALAVAGCLAVAATLALSASADVRITDQTYVRHDTGSDQTIVSCNDDTPGTTAGGERQQNEPTAAINPLDVNKMTAGANDYCTVPSVGDAWAGFYYSSNKGATWVNSLLPGYSTDTSLEGQASPLYRFVLGAGDPVQDWDRSNHLYYGGIAFNRVQPGNASIWVARYNWAPPLTAPDHEFTTIVSRGTPTAFGPGIFEDKVELEADDGVSSPHQGNVYVCWARFTASGSNNFIEFARSTDGGHTWTSQKISDSIHGNQECDIAVSRTGVVMVNWRQYEFKANQGQRQRDAIAWVRSDDGGATFTKPAIAREFLHWDMGDQTSNPVANGQVRYATCQAADGTLGGCESPEPKASARDCGDGPLACQSGYVFGRVNSAPRNAADPAAGADADSFYVVVEATVPGTEAATGTTYGTVDTGTASQSSIYFTKTTDGGANWSPLTRIDAQAKGNQFYSDIDANAGNLHVVWQDTRGDTATDWLILPFQNTKSLTNPPGSTSTSGAVQSFYATSSNGGGSWTSTAASSVGYPLNWEQFGNRDLPFFGDYNYISAVGSTVLMNWADGRDTLAGTDPRYTNGDGTDGFDVWQCRTQDPTTGAWSADTCPNAGGLDQQIWGNVIG